MYGAGQGYIDELLDGCCHVTELHAEVNPAFPGIHAPEPIGSNLKELLWTMKSGDYQVGLATDGDADRLGVADETGRFVNQLETYALLAYYLLEVRGQRGPLVKSVTTTGMINKLGALYGVPVHETPVGFKFLGPKMMETDAIIAGEESGGYGFKGHLPERDGVLAGLYFLDLMARTGRRPSELLKDLFAKVGPHFYERIDTQMDPEQRRAVVSRLEDAHPAEIAGERVTGRDTTDGFRFLFDKGWLLFRMSGTEPLVRIYTEVTDERLVQPVLEEGKQLAGLS
jgi:phosphomannomutase